MFQVRDIYQKPAYACIYCEKSGHKSSECELLSETPEGRLILSKKKLCFNCTGPKHRASDCSNKRCANCKGKLIIIHSRNAVVSNAYFHHQDHLDFVKHFINVNLLKKDVNS